MKRIFLRLKQPLRNERGEITFFACFFVVGIVMLISFLLLYASIRITCINIRNGAKMELNNLSGTIYADTYRSQRETNFEEYLNTLYSSSDYTDMLEATVAGGLDSKIPLSTEDYKVSDISLDFNVEDGRVEYIFYCDVEFYVRITTMNNCKSLFLDITIRGKDYLLSFNLHLYISLYPNCIVWRMKWRKWRMAYLAYTLLYSSGTFHCAN